MKKFKIILSVILSFVVMHSNFSSFVVAQDGNAENDLSYVWDFTYLYDKIKDNSDQLALLIPTSGQIAANYVAGGDSVTATETKNSSSYFPTSSDTVRLKISYNETDNIALDENGLYIGTDSNSSANGQNVSLDVFSGEKGGTMFIVTEKGNTIRGGMRSGTDGGSVSDTVNVDESYDLVSYEIPPNSVYYIGINEDKGHILKAEFVPKTIVTPTPTTTPTMTPMPTSTATPTATSTPIPVPQINQIRDFDGNNALVEVIDADAMLYAAAYSEDGTLKSVEVNTFNESGVYEVKLKNKADKVMLWDKNMCPYDSEKASGKIDTTPIPTPEAESDSISLNYTSYPLYVGNSRDFTEYKGLGDSVVITANVNSDEYSEQDIIWSVSNENIVDVKSENGNAIEIQAERTGVAEVVAKLPDGSKKTCYITSIDNYTRLTVQRIEFNIDKLNLKTGESAEVLPIIYPKDIYNNGIIDKTLSWSSSDSSVATVENGKVKGLKSGTAIITAISADVGIRGSFEVTVSDSTSTKAVTAVNTETINMKVGETYQLSAQCDGEIVWKSDNSYIANVDSDGVVTAYSKSAKQTLAENGVNMVDTPDTIKIYATSTDGGNVAEYNICVSDAPVETQDVDINKKEINIVKGTQKNITAVILPASLVNAQINWSTSDESVVSVMATERTIDGVNQAILTANNAGKAEIVAEYGGKTDVCKVTVTDSEVKVNNIDLQASVEIEIDEVYKLNAVPTKNATNRELIWISENSDIATVGVDGTIMGYKVGTIRVYAIATDSFTEMQISDLKSRKKSGERQFDETELSEYLNTYAVCEVTVKNSSPYLRNTHVIKESITHNSVNVLWNRASLTEAADFDKYRVYTNGAFVAETEKLGYTFADLQPDTEYQFKIAAINNNGDIVAEDCVSVKTKSEPIVLNVLDYGAIGDGKVTDTYAIQRAINACPENGVVLLPSGYTFYSGALFLKSDMSLQVDGVLLGSIDPKDYPEIVSRWEGWRKLPQSAEEWDNTQSGSYLEENEYTNASLINIGTYNEDESGKPSPTNIKNVVICGNGQINGNGYALAYNEGPNHIINNKGRYKVEPPATDPTTRGRTISMYNAESVYVKDVLVAYSPAWTNHITYSNNVTYDNVKVISSGSGVIGGDGGGHLYNGDGIDPDSSTNINIFNVFIKTGDDGVTLKSGRNREGNELDKPNAYIRITDCATKDSLGGFGTGSETAAGSHDILYQNLSNENASLYGMWFKTTEARGGMTENITIRDVHTDGAMAAIAMENTYVSSKHNPAWEYPQVRYITIDNVTGSNLTDYGLKFEGTKRTYINNITVIKPKFDKVMNCLAKYSLNFEIWDEENTEWTQENTSDIKFIYHKVLNDTTVAAVENAYRIRAVDNENKTISVINGVSKEDFLSELTSGMGGKQSYILSSDTINEDCKVTVISESGLYRDEYSIIVLDNIVSANLIGLSAVTEDGVELIEEFSMYTTEYNAKITKNIKEITITALKDDINANVTIRNNDVECDANTIQLLSAENVITIDVISSDGQEEKTYTLYIDNSYIIAEDFKNEEAGSWGFSGSGGAECADGILRLLPVNGSGKDASKTLDDSISTLEKVHISFDWKSDVENGKSRYSYFALQDAEGALIMGMFASGKAQVCYLTQTYDDYTKTLEDFTSNWYAVNLNIDFTAKTMSGTITNKDTGVVLKTFDDEAIEAENLSKMYAYDVYSAAPMSIDNVYIAEIK